MSKKGLSIHYSRGHKNLIIFIHGLFGSDTTWENKFGKHLTDVLDSEDNIKNNFDLGSFNYNSKVIKYLVFLKKNQLTIEELAEGLKSEINSRTQQYENIILIGHSMGGLIAKQYILKNLDNHKLKLYISIATPHLGSELAKFIKLYKHPQIMDLEKNSNYTTDLNREWRSQERNLPESYYLYGLEDKIAENKFAVPCEEIDDKYILGFMEDHSSIVKLEKTSTLFKCLNNILIDFNNQNNYEKILYINNSKKNLRGKEEFKYYLDDGYQTVETFTEKNKEEIFYSNGAVTTTLKNKEKFEQYLKELPTNLIPYIKAGSKLIYTGIPVIPLTFYEGYLMNLLTDIKYLVNFRNNSEKGYEELKHGSKEVIGYNVSDLNIITKDIKNVSINLSSTFEIKSENIPLLKNTVILEYKRKIIEIDHITHYEEVEKIADDFIGYIRRLKNEKNIKRINIFAGIPVPLSYEIARKIENHDPEIYVYHWENNRYEWGINIKSGILEIL